MSAGKPSAEQSAAETRYIAWDPFLDCDRDVKIRSRTVRMVTTRKPQMCVSWASGSHEIPAGTRARKEAAFIDGSPGCYYYCAECCAREIDGETFREVYPPDDQDFDGNPEPEDNRG